MERRWSQSIGFLVLLVGYGLVLRSGAFVIPGLKRPMVALSDTAWKHLFPQQYAKHRVFPERMSARLEDYPDRINGVMDALRSNAIAAKLSTPHLNAFLQIPDMLRRHPEIQAIGLSDGFRCESSVGMFQRIHEGIYPVRVVANDKSPYRLVSHAEIESFSDGERLDECREAVLVRHQ